MAEPVRLKTSLFIMVVDILILPEVCFRRTGTLHMIDSRSKEFWQRIYMLAYETVLVTLTLHKTLGHFMPRNSLAGTPITVLLRRDGMCFGLSRCSILTLQA